MTLEVVYVCDITGMCGGTVRAGQYDSIIVIPRYVNSLILIPKLFVLYDFIVINNIAT